MEDKFLVRVDEEMPSDERVAIRIMESGIGEELRQKVDILLEKADSIVATNNIEVLREMKDILSGLLDSIAFVNKKYAFVSEMILKLDEKTRLTEKIDTTYLENEIRGNNKKLDQMVDGLAELTANFSSNARSVERLEEKISVGLGEIMSGMEETAGRIGENINTAYMNDAELTGKINEIYVHNNEAFANMEGKLVRINFEINTRIDELSVSNAELIERARSLSSDLSAISERINEKIGEMSVINAEITEKIRDIKADDADKTRELSEKIDEISSGTAELIRGVEEKIGSVAANDIDVLARVDEKLSDMNARNKQLWDRLDEIARIDQKMDLIQDETKRSVTSLADEIRKYQEELRALIKTARARPRRKPKKVRRRVSRRVRTRRSARSKRQIEDEALDILVVSTLKNVSMNIDSLSRATGVSETRLRKRLAVLMTRGVVVREKRGRFIFYVSRVDEATEMDN